MRSVLGLMVTLALGLSACGGDDSDGGFVFQDAGPPPMDGGGGGTDAAASGDLRIDPPDQEVTIRDGAPAMVDYKAFLRQADGSERDVTSQATWTSSVAGLGSFDGARFTTATDRGGRTIIGARVGETGATTSLTVRLEQIVIADGAPADAAMLFDGPMAAGGGPLVVYPPDGVVVPPNLGELEFHYRPASYSVFELRFRAPALDLKVYMGCPESVGGGCVYTPSEAVWDTLQMAARGSGPIQVDLRGSDGAGGQVAAAPTREMTIAEEDITGGLYYWNALGGTINRFEFGRRGARAEVFLDQARTGAIECVGCHSLSRDGTRIAVGLNIPGATFQSYEVATRRRIFSLGTGLFPTQPDFFCFSPDSRQMVSGGGRALDLRDAETGMVTVPNVATNGTMPDWSPDGMHIVYARTDTAPPIDAPSTSSANIETLDFDGTTWLAGPTLIRRESENNYYPAYSPDGQFVVFIRSPSNTGSMGGTSSSTGGVADAQLWVVAGDGTGAALRLARAGGLADSWPKWDPTLYRNQGESLYWLAWSSQRAFGLRYGDAGHTQIWMAAFSPADARAGMDPAAAAFRLPFQSIDSGNHIPQWVTSVARQPCTSDAECAGEFCIDGVCVPEFI